MPSNYVANRGAAHMYADHFSGQTSGDEVTDYADVLDLEIRFYCKTYTVPLTKLFELMLGLTTRCKISSKLELSFSFLTARWHQ